MKGKPMTITPVALPALEEPIMVEQEQRPNGTVLVRISGQVV